MAEDRSWRVAGLGRFLQAFGKSIASTWGCCPVAIAINPVLTMPSPLQSHWTAFRQRSQVDRKVRSRADVMHSGKCRARYNPASRGGRTLSASRGVISSSLAI
jgi:hypothetical protein